MNKRSVEPTEWPAVDHYRKPIWLKLTFDDGKVIESDDLVAVNVSSAAFDQKNERDLAKLPAPAKWAYRIAVVAYNEDVGAIAKVLNSGARAASIEIRVDDHPGCSVLRVPQISDILTEGVSGYNLNVFTTSAYEIEE